MCDAWMFKWQSVVDRVLPALRQMRPQSSSFDGNPLRKTVAVVMVDFRRQLSLFEFVLRLAVYRMSQYRCVIVSFHVICGQANYDSMIDIVSDIQKQLQVTVHIHKWAEVTNEGSRDIYNSLLTTSAFWQQFEEEYILILQNDCALFQNRNGSEQFFCDLVKAEYDFIGAPITVRSCSGETTLFVGNGGFSLRRKQAMIEATALFLNTFCTYGSNCADGMITSIEEAQRKGHDGLIVPHSVREWMMRQRSVLRSCSRLSNVPEDIFFCCALASEKLRGKVAPPDVACRFVQESVSAPWDDLFGGHCWWFAAATNHHKHNFVLDLLRMFPFKLIRWQQGCEDVVRRLLIDHEDMLIFIVDFEQRHSTCKKNSFDLKGTHKNRVFVLSDKCFQQNECLSFLSFFSQN